ncbi:MAG: hypothetical protein ACOX6E_01640 [Syntrophomonadaceae bacterium]|jgi:hypothetical protein
MLAVLISLFIIIIALEVPGLLRHGQYRSLLVFSGFYILGVYLALAQFYGWPNYNPFYALGNLLGQMLGIAAPVLAGWVCV